MKPIRLARFRVRLCSCPTNRTGGRSRDRARLGQAACRQPSGQGGSRWPALGLKAAFKVTSLLIGTGRRVGRPARRVATVGLRLLGAALALLSAGAPAQTLSVEEWQPRSTLVVEEHPVPRAKFPVIDVHSHHRRSTQPERLAQIVAEMDDLNLAVLVNLSGGFGERLRETVRNFRGRYPERFAVFANPDFRGIGSAGWAERAVRQLEADVEAGAQGLKIFKNFGMTVRDSAGKRVRVDAPAMDPLWQACARLGIPVLIHVADPAEFWSPHDRFNERWLELKLRPGRKRPAQPSFEDLIGERDRLLARHPKVRFILAHLAWHGHDLGRLGMLLDRFPNVSVDIAAVLYELGRIPFSGRDFLIRYQDRVLFGKDSYQPDEFPYYWRVLETRDEYFEYYRRYHAHWRLYGLGLPDEALRSIYYRNALRLIPGIDASAFE